MPASEIQTAVIQVLLEMLLFGALLSMAAAVLADWAIRGLSPQQVWRGRKVETLLSIIGGVVFTGVAFVLLTLHAVGEPRPLSVAVPVVDTPGPTPTKSHKPNIPLMTKTATPGAVPQPLTPTPTSTATLTPMPTHTATSTSTPTASPTATPELIPLTCPQSFSTGFGFLSPRPGGSLRPASQPLQVCVEHGRYQRYQIRYALRDNRPSQIERWLTIWQCFADNCTREVPAGHILTARWDADLPAQFGRYILVLQVFFITPQGQQWDKEEIEIDLAP